MGKPKQSTNLLRCLVGDSPGNWDLVLPQAEFAYNSSVNRSTGKSPFKIVHGYKPRKLTDLIPLSHHARVSVSAESFAQHIRELHEQICTHLNKSNESYKRQKDVHQRPQKFQEGEFVMVRTERLLLEKVSKLESRGSRPFKVLRRFGTNAYELELPKEFGVNSTFNVSDLVPYKGPAMEPSKELEPSSTLEREPSPPPSI